MKKTIVLSILLIFFTAGLGAQENCSKYYPMVEGSSFEYTNFGKKDKVEGVTSFTVSSVAADGSATKATLDFKMSDKKGKEIYASNYSFRCEGNMVKIDYQSLFPAQMMKQYSAMNVDMDISGTDIELPNNLSVGQDLSDANVSIAMNMSGIKMNISVDQTNRKVVNKESVTTTAGTFDCIVITETTRSKTMGSTMEFNSKLWLAEGIGMIKQETYKKNGDVLSKTELSKFSK